MNACILAHENDAIEKLFRIPRRTYEFLDNDLKPQLYKGGGSKYEMYFPSMNSRLYCDLESRGDTIHWLHISEKAFVDDEQRVKATIECVPLNGIITVETTANGLNHFADDWFNQDSNYEKLFFPWFFHEEYFIRNHDITSDALTSDELEFIKKTKQNYHIDITLDQIAFRRFKQREQKGLFKQEYPEDDMSCFLTSGTNPFDMTNLKQVYSKLGAPIEIIDDIKIYRHREHGKLYVIAADPAEGVDSDFSAAQVFEVFSREQVATFQGQLKPSDFADKLIEMSKLYSSRHECLIVVEKNNHGHAVLLKLYEIHNYFYLFKLKY
jgi:hypothetical protein